MSTLIAKVQDKLDRMDDAHKELTQAQCDAKEAESELKAAIIGDAYLCHYVMTINYTRLRKELRSCQKQAEADHQALYS